MKCQAENKHLKFKQTNIDSESGRITFWSFPFQLSPGNTSGGNFSSLMELLLLFINYYLILICGINIIINELSFNGIIIIVY